MKKMRHNSRCVPKVSAMTRPFQIEISESQQELEKRSNMPRLQAAKKDCALLWLKSGQWIADKRGRTQDEIKQLLLVGLKKYTKMGCSGLLEVKHAPGQAPLVTLEALRTAQTSADPQSFIAMVQNSAMTATELKLIHTKRSISSFAIGSMPS